MAHTIHVDIVSAEGQIFSGDATMVFAPGSQGELGIAPRHAPLLAAFEKAGEVHVQEEGQEEQVFYVGAARWRVAAPSGHRTRRYGGTCPRPDEAAAHAAKRRAEDAIRSRGDKMDAAEAQAEWREPWRNCERSTAAPKTLGVSRQRCPDAAFPSVPYSPRGRASGCTRTCPRCCSHSRGSSLLPHVVRTAHALIRRPSTSVYGYGGARCRRRCRTSTSIGYCRPSSRERAMFRDAGHVRSTDDHTVLVLYGDLPLMVRHRSTSSCRPPARARRRAVGLSGRSVGLRPHRARPRPAASARSSSTMTPLGPSSRFARSIPDSWPLPRRACGNLLLGFRTDDAQRGSM